MARSLNQVSVIGNVGNEPEIRATGSGARVAKLSLATNRSFQDKSGQQQERTEWHRLTVFGRLVDVIEQWVKKGDRLYVEGRLEYSQTQDDQGVTKYWTDIVIYEMIMLGSVGAGGAAQDGGGGGYQQQTGHAAQAPREEASITQPDDDLPF